jgi:HEAT repeat protein
MRRGSGDWRLAMKVGGIAAIAIAIACASDGNAQGATAQRPSRPDDTAAVTRLLSAVRGADPLLCEMAARNVDMHGWWSHGAPMGSNPLDRDSTSAAIIMWIQTDHTDPAVVPTLRTAMRDTDGCVRRVAASFLGRVEHPSATAALVGALEDQSAETRFLGALGLGLGETSSATQSLVAALKDDTPAVRRAAAWALGSIEARSAQDALIQLLERDSDARVRQAAAWAIGKIHN